MRRLSADSRREIIDWIIFSVSGEELYGDERDVQPIDWDAFSIEQWSGRRYEAQLRRKRLTALSDSSTRRLRILARFQCDRNTISSDVILLYGRGRRNLCRPKLGRASGQRSLKA